MEQMKGDAGFASKLFAPLMQQLKGGQDQEANLETHQRIAESLVERKFDSSWAVNQGKFGVTGKYSFSVLTQQDYVFVDGNQNNVDVLKREDLTRIGSMSTDNCAIFSFIMHGLKLFVGCSNNNLFVYEVDTLKRFKDIKSTSIIYCFH